MRPRVFPAEDAINGVRLVHDYYGASMRPRVFPAEDADHVVGRGADLPLQ